MKWFFVFVVLFVLSLMSFFISGLFFLNSGIVNFEDDSTNEVRTVEVLRAFDEIPFLFLDSEDVHFGIYGEIIEIQGDRILVEDRHRGIWFDANSSNYSVGKIIYVRYKYDLDYNVEVVEIVDPARVKRF